MVTPAQRIQVSSTLCCGGRQYALLVVSHLSNLKSGVNVNTAPRNVEGDIGRCIQRNRNWQLTLLYVSTVGKNFRPLVMTENFVALSAIKRANGLQMKHLKNSWVNLSINKKLIASPAGLQNLLKMKSLGGEVSELFIKIKKVENKPCYAEYFSAPTYRGWKSHIHSL